MAGAVVAASRPPTVGEARSAAAAIGAARPDVARVMLFGSVARGEAVTGEEINEALTVLRQEAPPLTGAEIVRRGSA